MPFKIVRQDITKMKVDVIVNSTSKYPILSGGTDSHIHEVAGPNLLIERKAHNEIQTTQAIITKGYQLPASYVIHTVGPIYKDGMHQEEKQLYETYKNCLELASKHQLKSIAFPLISSGNFGYPKDQAIDIAIKAIKEYLIDHEMEIYLVVYDQVSFKLSKERIANVDEYLDTHYIPSTRTSHSIDDEFHVMYNEVEYLRSLDDVIDELDETFVEKLFRFIREKQMEETTVYKNANLTRQHFSKIRSDDNYQPKKETALGLAIALNLNLDETKDLLNAAGYALSKSSKFDMIIQYHIENEIYDFYEINLVLYHYKQKLIS